MTVFKIFSVVAVTSALLIRFLPQAIDIAFPPLNQRTGTAWTEPPNTTPVSLDATDNPTRPQLLNRKALTFRVVCRLRKISQRLAHTKVNVDIVEMRTNSIITELSPHIREDHFVEVKRAAMLAYFLPDKDELAELEYRRSYEVHMMLVREHIARTGSTPAMRLLRAVFAEETLIQLGMVRQMVLHPSDA